MKTIQYFSLLLCTPLLYACNNPAPKTVANHVTDTIPVSIIPLKQQNSDETMVVSGQFTTDDEVMLSFKTSGIISSLNVKEGDAVKSGQLLATLNPTEINAQVQQAQLANEKAKRDYQRTQNLYQDSVATLEQLQNSKTTLQQTQQQLSMATFNRQYSEIHAPKNGYVLHKLANTGQQVSAGAPVLETNGAHSGKWLLRSNISDQQWAKLQPGDQAQVVTTALPGTTLQGVVTRKSEGIDAATGTFTADITLTGNPKAIAAGMFGKAILTPAHQTTGAWQIPYEALLDGDGNSGYVFVTDDNKIAHKVKVTVAGINKNTATITDGLGQSKSLIVSGSAYLTDNSAITISSPVKAAK
ncbi:efflux RND transporter periplasmic adaptor subunit [Mucilaginibacter sp. SP1R1]|uniref:efflux RND transporter periplasmic adaptor subunit n=1 Tax=Mucilaginibacter sp. SP1R1 TaxID=2723091 RepID=UPI001610FE6A|nr:efflux RND transporter periplasmic adaptor subunit [Mucilaginibacter sp. SP1R1]MBB6148460.1 RND family efflux transporter MFP subunit [Mucilaginibacter sp. SP1R1]